LALAAATAATVAVEAVVTLHVGNGSVVVVFVVDVLPKIFAVVAVVVIELPSTPQLLLLLPLLSSSNNSKFVHVMEYPSGKKILNFIANSLHNALLPPTPHWDVTVVISFHTLFIRTKGDVDADDDPPPFLDSLIIARNSSITFKTYCEEDNDGV
jgi:hypothetical protein